MIIEHANDVETTESTGHDFGIDEASMGMLFKGFSDNLYSNKIGSVVREIASNCFDAHQELGTNQDVHISLSAPDPIMGTPGKISFRDFGIGLSPDRVEKIYSKYFASTKRTTNGQIGGFGIGAKSPLAYTDIFEVITIVEGTKYHYMMHRGEQVPRIDLIDTESSDEPRGTEIIIPIKNSKDYNKFKQELYSQLRYFDGIKYFGLDIDNDYKIIKAKNFIANTRDLNDTHQIIGLCIGKVGYPIKTDLVWEDGRYSSYHLKSPISLYFDIGELSVTMNREDVEYTEEAIDLIKERFELAMEEAQTLRNNNLKKEENFVNYISKALTTDYITINDKGDKISFPSAFNMSSVKEWNTAPLNTLKFFKPHKEVFNDFLKVSHYYDGSVVHKKWAKTGSISIFNAFMDIINGNSKTTIYRSKGVVSAKTLAYVKDTCTTSKFIIVKLDKKDPDDMYSESLSVLRDGRQEDLSRDNWDKFLEELKVYSNYVMKYFIKNTESFDKIEISDEWNEAYKSARTVTRTDEEITIRPLTGYNSYRLHKVKTNQLYSHYHKNMIMIYGYQGEEEAITRADHIMETAGFDRYDCYNIFKVSRDNARKFIEPLFPNAVHVNDLEEMPRVKDNVLRTKAFAFLFDKSKILNIDFDMSYQNLTLLSLTNKMKGALEVPLSFYEVPKRVFTDKQRFVCSQGPNDDEGNPTYKVFDNKYMVDLTLAVDGLIDYFGENDLMLRLITKTTIHPGTEEHDFFKKALKQNFKPFNINY